MEKMTVNLTESPPPKNTLSNLEVYRDGSYNLEIDAPISLEDKQRLVKSLKAVLALVESI